MNKSTLGLIALAMVAFFPGAAWADDWQITKLRGAAAALVDGTWRPIHRGDVISDDRAIQTLDGSRLSLQRGNETIDLGPNTAITIKDRDGQQYTIVSQYFGTVEVEAEIRDVNHFEVVTPMLAALVKGTHFNVTSGEHSAKVSVKRGHVAVKDSDTGQSVLLAKDQSATTTDDGGALEIAGSGELPTVLDAQGKEVATANVSAPEQTSTSSAANGDDSSEASNGGRNRNSNGYSGGHGNGHSGDHGGGHSGGGHSGGGHSGGRHR